MATKQNASLENLPDGSDFVTTLDAHDKLIEKWEAMAKSWMQIAIDRNDDAPDMANRAQARAEVYQDCVVELKASIASK